METVENNKKVVITKKAPTAAQIARAKSRRDHVLRQMRKEKRFMLLSAVVAGGAIFIWIVAIATDWWYFTEGVGHSGLWRSCFVQNSGGGGEEICKYHKLFPSREELKRSAELDQHVLDYRRTQLTFALLSLFLMLLAILAAFYTFKNGRYVYKRLASGLFFITAATTLVTMEAVITCLRYELENFPAVTMRDTPTEDTPTVGTPPGDSSRYAYSFYLGWFVFATYLWNGCVFLMYSRKKKWVIDEGE